MNKRKKQFGHAQGVENIEDVAVHGNPQRSSRRFKISRKRWRVLGLFLMLAIGLVFRVPWRNADAGNEAFWTYGYFVTDEGYYTGGGRLAFLEGNCLDPELHEPTTFGAAPAMHYLSALSYRVRGLTFDACRWPTMLAGVTGWGCAFWLASSVTHPLVALAVTAPISLNPLSLTYERSSSSDAALAGFLMLALCLMRSRRHLAFLLGGMLFAVVPAIKASGIAFAPLFFLMTMAVGYKRWWRAGLSLTGYLIGWGAMHGLDAWMLGHHPSGLSAELLRNECSMSAGALPPRPTLQQAIRAFPIFPRYPVDTRLGVFVAWCLALPVWGMLSHVSRGWTRRLQRPVLYVGSVLYVLAMAVQIQSTERYFLPLIMLAPWLLVSGRTSVFRWMRGKCVYRVLALSAAGLLILCLFWLGEGVTGGHNPRHFLTNEYNLPEISAWVVLWKALLLSTFLLALALAPWSRTWAGALMVLPVGLVAANFLWHAWPTARFGGRFSLSAQTSFFVQQILLIGTLALFAAVPRKFNWRIWYCALGVMYVMAFLVIPQWRQALPLLWRRPENTLKVAEELARQLPKNSIVLGNRASSLLRATRFRLGFCSPNFEAKVFVEKVCRLMRDHPNSPLFLLVDEDHNYHWSYIQKAGADLITTKVAGSVSLPAAGGKGQNIRVFVVQLMPKQLARDDVMRGS
ncbi:MAG: hypothetical protein PHU80_03940 [Kiritimatiellae bacterium]|nr:hypothetical protein [Kiritimatiellia bacterium]